MSSIKVNERRSLSEKKAGNLVKKRTVNSGCKKKKNIQKQAMSDSDQQQVSWYHLFSFYFCSYRPFIEHVGVHACCEFSPISVRCLLKNHTCRWCVLERRYFMFPSTQEAEKVPQPQWPENGEEWSDGEDGTSMDCGLLQAMAEEDEEINVYNEETFGMGV